MVPAKLIESLGSKYGAVVPIEYQAMGGKPTFFVVRRPKFDEYVLFNKYAVNNGTEDNPYFDIHEDAAFEYFSKVVVYPEGLDPNQVPVGSIFKACALSVELSSFNDPDKFKEMYIRSIKNVFSQAGAILMKIVGAFGIQGYMAVKDLEEHELVDLIAMVEALTDSHGDLAKLTNMPGIPFKGKKLDIERLLGVQSKAPDAPNRMDDNKRKKLEMYYESLGYTPERIEKTIQALEAKGTEFKRDRNAVDADGKIDMSLMSDAEIQSMSQSEYNKLQKEGKILSHEESQKRAMEDSKDDLRAKIEQDKEVYGKEEHAPKTVGTQHWKGDLGDLLKQVKTKINQEELE